MLLFLFASLWKHTMKGPISKSFYIYLFIFTFYCRKVKEFGVLENDYVAGKKMSAYSDSILFINLDYRNWPHSLKLKSTLWQE